MSFRRVSCGYVCAGLLLGFASFAPAQSSSSSKSAKQTLKPSTAANSPLDSGSVNNGIYRNAAFGFTCKIPAGWVLRTEEMNARDDSESASKDSRAALDRAAGGACPYKGGCGRVLLAAFSRPPEAHGEDINSSILIAAESASAYPGLKDPAQYFGPLTEVAKAQGFASDQDTYEFPIGTKTLVRGDFEKDVATRRMLQSTLVTLARGYAVSFTFIGGTEDEVEDLVQGLSFGAAAKPHSR
ncbi:MAG: hypothetical protein WBX38_10015 [Candidatus Sulfotelmatobacter sp.]